MADATPKDGKWNNIAVLIDADNISSSDRLKVIMEKISPYGHIALKRAYGNWRKDQFKKWPEELNRLGIQARQQFDYVGKKNATDMTLTIDAVCLQHEDKYEAFVIGSSDSDYIPLANYLRGSGAYVIGVGPQNPSKPFEESCNEFIPLSESGDEARKANNPKDGHESTIHELLKNHWDKNKDEKGFADLGSAKTFVKRAQPEFTHPGKRWSTYVKAFSEKYEVHKNRYRCLEPPSKKPSPEA